MRGFLQGAPKHNLEQLVAMRNVAIVVQTFAILVAERGMGLQLPLAPMGATIAALAVFNATTWWRLRSGGPVRDLELMGQLLVDVAVLTALLALAGGATNPFIGMFLLPLTITAACLRWSYTWTVAMVTMACYSMLVLFYRPLFGPGEESRYLDLLVSGMWVNYAISAGMIAHFVGLLSLRLRGGEHDARTDLERELCNEHLARIGTLAAGAAHELAQPLGTMSLVIEELDECTADDPRLTALVRDLQLQLNQCQSTLTQLLGYGKDTFDTGVQTGSLYEFTRRCIDAFATRRPKANVTLYVDGVGEVPSIHHDQALAQGILNLLGNAADVSPDWIEVRIGWDDDSAALAVCDRGPGLPPALLNRIGKLFFTTKPRGVGNGLGLVLATTAVSRLGGSLQLSNRPEGGARAEIVLPRVQTPHSKDDLAIA